MSTSPLSVDSTTLRASGREPPCPFDIVFEDSAPLQISRLLRVLPGKRIVAEAHFNGERVLAKLFIAPGNKRHWQREYQGIAALTDAGLATPAIIASGQLAGGGYALLTRFLDPAEKLSDVWTRANSSDDALAALSPALTAVARLHEAGLAQDDLHLGNFLVHLGALYVIDGDAVHAVSPGKPLDREKACDNLAILLAQLPAEWDVRQNELLTIYHRHTSIRLESPVLLKATQHVREHRMRDYLRKSLRDCTLFAVRREPLRFLSTVREQATALQETLADPDRAIRQGVSLKDGGTATVARIDNATLGPLVIKRYNLKNFRHTLSRLWRPSRAWHSWREGLRLRFLGIATPQPLALLEQRIGPLRRRAWLITAYCDGPNLFEHLDPAAVPPPAEAAAINTLFSTLYRERISHGDLKATNLLWHDRQVMLIDLDAMRQHRSQQTHRHAWRRDRARLLRNWPEDSILFHWLDANLPAA